MVKESLALLKDLSKAYDCLPHDLLIAKLAAYGFGIDSLNLLHSYLSCRKQHVKIGSTFSDWHYISSGIQQGSILEPLLFNICIHDRLLCIEKSGMENDKSLWLYAVTLLPVGLRESKRTLPFDKSKLTKTIGCDTYRTIVC